ncbi:hypothetical protein QTP81_12725 [Alteromonas sp. ASW11-36]|uniref:DUF302 domain-containing protein n=1 Tax=Alteromonas arenosi TaxID=3055817 RepID=A0ABT7SZ38_9ALTE|nr:hypothetical protein [Alteromonas sp. ASW11-36]MDM7861458.1 hypothetical protein [Alteromonas sp. ASW11-36]
MTDSVKALTDYIDVLEYVWMGVPFNVPMFEVYAQIPNPVAYKTVKFQQQNLQILQLGKYDVPLFEPLGLELEQMPAYAVVLADYQGSQFRLLARPADHINGVNRVARELMRGKSTFSPSNH